jgi:hypothetical protein
MQLGPSKSDIRTSATLKFARMLGPEARAPFTNTPLWQVISNSGPTFGHTVYGILFNDKDDTLFKRLHRI